MAGDIELVLFLEDPAHEAFLVVVVRKIAADLGIDPDRIEIDVRNATGGKGQAISSYSKFLKDIASGRVSAARIVVAIDSDCQSTHDVITRMKHISEQIGFAGTVIGAVPVPHIERWYMLDVDAFRVGTGGASAPVIPFRCESEYYKHALIEALADFGITAPLAAAPYGAEIATALNLNTARHADSSFEAFYTDLREALIPEVHAN
jgi:hypothetical protein